MLSSSLLPKFFPFRSTMPRALLQLLYCNLVKMACLYTAQYCVMYKIFNCKFYSMLNCAQYFGFPWKRSKSRFIYNIELLNVYSKTCNICGLMCSSQNEEKAKDLHLQDTASCSNASGGAVVSSQPTFSGNSDNNNTINPLPNLIPEARRFGKFDPFEYLARHPTLFQTCLKNVTYIFILICIVFWRFSKRNCGFHYRNNKPSKFVYEDKIWYIRWRYVWR